MQKSEREFLKHVTNEIKPLEVIAKEIGWNYDTAKEYAVYLNKEGLIRLSYMTLNNGGTIYVVANPIKKVNWTAIYTNVIAVCAVCLGAILSWYLQGDQKTEFPKIVIVHDTIRCTHSAVIIHDTLIIKK